MNSASDEQKIDGIMPDDVASESAAREQLEQQLKELFRAWDRMVKFIHHGRDRLELFLTNPQTEV